MHSMWQPTWELTVRRMRWREKQDVNSEPPYNNLGRYQWAIVFNFYFVCCLGSILKCSARLFIQKSCLYIFILLLQLVQISTVQRIPTKSVHGYQQQGMGVCHIWFGSLCFEMVFGPYLGDSPSHSNHSVVVATTAARKDCSHYPLNWLGLLWMGWNVVTPVFTCTDFAFWKLWFVTNTYVESNNKWRINYAEWLCADEN